MVLMKSRSTMKLFVLALLSSFLSEVSGQSLHKIMEEVKEKYACRVYLAPSHLSTDTTTRFGLFAGVDFDVNETIPQPEIGIPLVDFLEGPWSGEYPDMMQVLEGSFWTADHVGARFEGNQSSTVFVPGFGSLAHYHAGIYNIDWDHSSALLREREDITEPGKAHPTRGAITSYHNLTMKASRKIPAGMELFANFGDVWDENKLDVYEQTLTRWDYADADKVLDKIQGFMDRFEGQMSEELKDDVLDLIVGRVLRSAAGKRGKTIGSLIPSSPRKLKKVQEAGGTFNFRNSDMVKSQSWLKKNGVCVDTLEARKSTIPEAGRGAFATRDFKEGERITITPLLLIPSDRVMAMYDIVEKEQVDEDGEKQTFLEYDIDKPLNEQLVLNYAFGHGQSGLLFLPLSPHVALINHGFHGMANAQVDWSDHEKIVHGFDFHNVVADELKNYDTPNLVLQVVATRDIKKGEEILIDYGIDWELAWEEWKQEYDQKHADGKWPLKAEDIRALYKDKPWPVNIRSDNMPYPPGVVTACFVMSDTYGDGHPRQTEAGNELLVWTGPKNREDYRGFQLTICDLLEREESEEHGFIYSINMKNHDGYIVQVDKVPHAAITAIDRPYTGDTHSPGAFRRWISIPDERFPQKWRNLRSVAA